MLALLSLTIAAISHFYLLTEGRELGSFPVLTYSTLLISSLIFGYTVNIYKKSGQAEVSALPNNLNVSLKKTRISILCLAIMISVLSSIRYSSLQESPILITCWIFSLLLGTLAMFPTPSLKVKIPKFTNFRRETVSLCSLICLLIPIYLFNTYLIPWQINSDEVAGPHFINQLKIDATNILGPSTYYGSPALLWIIYQILGNFLGEVSLENVRLIHASTGIIIVVLSYFFFRLSFRFPVALMGSIILGLNHSLIGTSRAAILVNSALFNEILALIFLFWGIKQKSALKIFLGGVFLGLCFYSYAPSKIAPIIFFLFLALCSIIAKTGKNLKTIAKIFLISFSGFVICASPIIFSTLKNDSLIIPHSQEGLLISKEGRELAKNWAGSQSIEVGVKENIARGLLTFNSRTSDNGWEYANLGFAFTDPVSGLLIWIGLAVIIFKKRRNIFDIFVASSFIFLYILFAFIINKAPNFSRLLIILPFTSYLIIEAVMAIGSLIKIRKINTCWAIVLFLALVNLDIYLKFVRDGYLNGDTIGSMGRYTKTVSTKNPDQTFYLITDNLYPVHNWGFAQMWTTWIAFFAKETNKVIVLDSKSLPVIESFEEASTVYMTTDLWQTKPFSPNFSDRVIRWTILLSPNPKVVAVEIKSVN